MTMLIKQNIINDVGFSHFGFRVKLVRRESLYRENQHRCSRYASLLEHRTKSGFRVVLSEAKDISRKPLQSVFSIRFATRTPNEIWFSSSPERSEGHIEKTTTISVLDTLRYSNTERNLVFE